MSIDYFLFCLLMKLEDGEIDESEGGAMVDAAHQRNPTTAWSKRDAHPKENNMVLLITLFLHSFLFK